MFTRIGDVLPLRGGGVIVVDLPASGRGSARTRGPAFVRQYDRAGQYVRALGRSGTGPGEFGEPTSIGELPDGSVVLYDGGRRHVIVYAPNGSVTAQWPFDAGPGGVALWGRISMTDTAGFVYLPLATPLPGRGPRPTEPPGIGRGQGRPTTLVRFRPDGTLVDSLFEPEFPSAPRYNREAFTVHEGTGLREVMLPLWPQPQWMRSRLGYFVTAVPHRYAVDLRIPSATVAGKPSIWRTGDRVVSIRRNVQPIPVSNEERAERRAIVERTLQTNNPGWRWTGEEIPAVKPAIHGAHAAFDGRIWVSLTQPSVRVTPQGRGTGISFGEPAPLWDIFEPDGTYLGQVRGPDSLSLRIGAMRGDNVWSVATDQNGVQTVKRWRIAW
jgi:hypothetical protein